MDIAFALHKILRDEGITVSRFASESRVSYGTIHRITHNQTPSIRLDTLQAILDTLCQLTGHCYGVEDVIGDIANGKEQESHKSLPDQACDSVRPESLDSSSTFLPVFYTGDNRLPVTAQDICTGSNNDEQ